MAKKPVQTKGAPTVGTLRTTRADGRVVGQEFILRAPDAARPSSAEVRAAIQAAVDAIRANPGVTGPGLGLLLEHYLAEPVRVDLMTGDMAAKRLHLASYRGPDERRAEVVRELLASSDRLVRLAAQIAEGGDLPAEQELRRLRVPDEFGSTDSQRIDLEQFLMFARSAASLLVNAEQGPTTVRPNEPGIDRAEFVKLFLTTNWPSVAEKLSVRMRARATLEHVRAAGAAWSKRGKPARGAKPLSKWDALQSVAKSLGLNAAALTLETRWKRMKASRNRRVAEHEAAETARIEKKGRKAPRV